MHKITEILNNSVSALSTVTLNSRAVKIERFKPDLPTSYPLIRVVMGPESNNDESFDQDERELSVFTDIYVSNTANTIEDDALLIRTQIENIFNNRTGFTIGYLQQIRLVSQDEAVFNEQESDDFTAMLRLTWSFTYMAEAIF